MTGADTFQSAHAAYAQMVLFDAADVPLLLDVSALGIVHMVIADGPIEQANAFGVVKDFRLFQYATLVGRYAQEVLRHKMRPLAPDLAALANLPINPVLDALMSITGAASDPRSELPNIRLGELLGEAIPDLQEHARLTVAHLVADMSNRGGAGATLIRSAIGGLVRASHWGSAPWWDAIVRRSAELARPEDGPRLAPMLPQLLDAPFALDPDDLSWYIHRGWFVQAHKDVLFSSVCRPKQR